MVFPLWLNAIGARPGGTAPMVVRPGGTALVCSPPVPVVRSSLTTSTSPASPPVDLVRGTTGRPGARGATVATTGADDVAEEASGERFAKEASA